MARSRQFLLDAATVERGREDRLTEILATVLDENDQLVETLLAELGVPLCHRYEVATQVHKPGGRPDMVITGFEENGSEALTVWSEHKVDAGFGVKQIERYRAALDAEAGHHRALICIVDAEAARQELDVTRALTWQQVAEIAERAGRGWAKRSWREEAVRPDAPAKWRLVAELLWYLETKEDLAMAQGLDAEHVAGYGAAAEALVAVTGLHDRAARTVTVLPVGKAGGDWEAGLVDWQTFEPDPSMWIARPEFDGWAEFAVADRDHWGYDRLDAPAFGAGFTLEGRHHGKLSANREWTRQLDEAGFSCALWANCVRLWRTYAMADVLELGDSLDTQAHGLAAWVDSAFTDLARLPPREDVVG